MKIYTKNSKGKFKEITLKRALLKALENATVKYDVEADMFDDESASWINVKKSGEDIGIITFIDIAFEKDNNTLRDIQVWETVCKIEEGDQTRKF